MSTAKKKSTSPVTGAVDAVAEQFESAADMIKGGVDAAIDAGAEQTRAACAFEGVEFAGRDNLDAALKSSEAYYASLKDLNDLVFKSAKEATRFNADAVKTLTGCKTPEDLTQAQMKLVSSSFENAMSLMDTFGKAATKAAGDVSAPLQAQFGQPFQPFQQFWTKTAA